MLTSREISGVNDELKNQCFRDLLMMETENMSETLLFSSTLT
jgi:hypothetical protein